MVLLPLNAVMIVINKICGLFIFIFFFMVVLFIIICYNYIFYILIIYKYLSFLLLHELTKYDNGSFIAFVSLSLDVLYNNCIIQALQLKLVSRKTFNITLL